MSEVSIFNKIDEVTNPENLDIIIYLEQTRDGRWKDLVLECRRIEDKKERDAFKKTMPTTTLSGKFKRRDDYSIDKHSGFIAMDLDDVEDLDGVKKALVKDKHVFAIFLSTSGNGYRVLFKIKPEKHRESFRGISKHLYDKYGIVSDLNGVNVSKPYVVSYDPLLYLHWDYEKCPEWTSFPKETPIKPLANFVHTATDFDMVLHQVVGKRINLCEDYNDWLKVGFAIAEEFGENGRHYFHQISQFSAKYKVVECDKQYTAFLKARGSTKANIATFYYLAKINGVSIVTEQTKNIVRTTKNGKKAGLKPQQIIDNLKKFHAIEGADEVVQKVFDSVTHEDAGTDEESVLHQLEMFISNNYSLKMNEVTGYLENNYKQLGANELNSIFVSAKKLMPKLDYQLMMRLLKSDYIEHYNPFFKFFGSDGIPVILPPTAKEDQVVDSPLIDKLAETIKNNDPMYTSFFLRKWIVGIVSAAHKVHSPLLLCLLGKEHGTGKTEWFRRLLPAELQEYYAESKLDKEKDDELLMTENIIVMDDELGGKSKQDNMKLKNITSKQYFSLRRPYADHNEKILRLAVLCGTSNYLDILSDSTGNRRIIPIEVQDINKELYNSIDKKELFMEAFRLYKEGFDWRVTAKDVKYLNKDNDKYEMVIPERELIEKYFERDESENSLRMSSTEIKVDLELITHQRLNMAAIGRELEKLGFLRKSTRLNMYSTPKLWCVRKIGRAQEVYVPAANQITDKKDEMPF